MQFPIHISTLENNDSQNNSCGPTPTPTIMRKVIGLVVSDSALGSIASEFQEAYIHNS